MVFVCIIVIQVIKYTLNKGKHRPIKPILFHFSVSDVSF